MKTRWLHRDEALTLPFEITEGGEYTFFLRYSNDGPEDTIELRVNGATVGQVTTQDTRIPGRPPGSGWEEFKASASVGPVVLAPGAHEVRLVVVAGDLFGVELDCVSAQHAHCTEAGRQAEETSGGSVPPSVLDSLLVWYDFEGDFLTSGRVIDRSGNGHGAQVIGTLGAAKGITGGHAISFSGSSYIQAEGNPVAGRQQVTFSLWFKTDHPKANYKLASAAWWRGGPASGWILATHAPEFWSDDTRGLLLSGSPNVENNFPAGEWVHEAVTYDGEQLKEYTNGQLINVWPTTGAEIGTGEHMVVGAWPPWSAYNFEGSIDEFQIFDRALTAEEVQALYNLRR